MDDEGKGKASVDITAKLVEVRPLLIGTSIGKLRDEMVARGKEQDPDWFFGAGVKITDDDLKSLLGLFSAKP